MGNMAYNKKQLYNVFNNYIRNPLFIKLSILRILAYSIQRMIVILINLI